jgi:threonine dehydrogenase-like Zn-dependent dehydrogenase
MKTIALRLYGKRDLRLESFELPELKDDEILAEIVTDSVCMSSYKAALLGPEHERVPDDVHERPTIIGHEFAGIIRKAGKKWADRYKPGMKFTIQPALNYKGTLWAPGYSFQYIGGMATYVIIPSCVMEMNCLLIYEGDGFFKASLSEPMSCIIGACHAQYHSSGVDYTHSMGIVSGGNSAIIGGAGPMGLGFIDYLVHGPVRPGLLVVTDVDEARLKRASEIISPAEALSCGVTLKYINTAVVHDVAEYLLRFTDMKGYDDVFVLVANEKVVELADALLAKDGCLNFFAGPTKADFSARINLYRVHYRQTHIVGTSGGKASDMKEALDLISANVINPSAMITHIGGITCGRETILNLPSIPGGKKLIYTHYDLPLTAIADFHKLGKGNQFFAGLAEICTRHNGLWNVEAEHYLLEHAPQYVVK